MQQVSHAVQSSTLSDVLERVLDKGIVIAGDIKVKLVDIELLSVQIRLVICSVDKAREMGMDWWVNNPVFSRQPAQPQLESSLSGIERRLERLEALPVAQPARDHVAAPSDFRRA
jgi:gas vesicle protein GvpA/GvpJ/GvpM family